MADRWVLGVGASYTMDVWTFGIGYSINEADIDNEGGDDSDFTLQRAVITANYTLGPGIDLDGAIGYTWQDVSGPDFDESADNYDALEIGIGTGDHVLAIRLIDPGAGRSGGPSTAERRRRSRRGSRRRARHRPTTAWSPIRPGRS